MIRHLRALALAGAFSLALALPALAQQFPSGSIQGNAGASTATPRAITPHAWLDRWCGSTSGFVPYRTGGSTWACAAPGATSGVQPYDADLAALAGLTSANNKCFYWTGTATAANYDCTSFGRGVSNAADATALRVLAGTIIGTNVQAWDADLDALAGLTSANNKCFYWTGTATAANYDCTSYGRSLANAADAAALRVLAGAVIGTNVQAWDADLDALAAFSSTGFAARTASNTWAQRTLQAPAAGFTITNPAGVAGDPTFVLANDLAAVEGLSGTGIARRTGTDAWSVGTLVTNAELANMANATFKCRTTAGTGVPEDCTATQLKTLASLTPGTDIQAYSALLASIAGLTVAQHDLIVATAAATVAAKSLPDCTDTGGNHLNYTRSTQAFSCGTSGGAGGGVTSLNSKTGGVVFSIVYQIFVASGTYTPTTGMVYAETTCYGAGAGGGGAATTTTGFTSGGGGGAGSKSMKHSTAADIGASQTVTIGAAGTAGSAGANNGGAGGDTSLGSICVGKGGAGGAGAALNSGGAGGAGGVAGTGDVTGTGQNGMTGVGAAIQTVGAYSNAGGSTDLGGGGAAPVQTTGIAGTGYGSGGSGGSTFAAAVAGGVGRLGIVIIKQFVIN